MAVDNSIAVKIIFNYMEIIVDKVTYQFPERLTIEQWQHIMQWDFTIQSNWPKIIAYVTDIPQSLLERGNEEALELGAALIVTGNWYVTLSTMISI